MIVMSRKHLTVREMIAALEKMPQDAQVFCYDGIEEADCRIVNEPKIFTRDQFTYFENNERGNIPNVTAINFHKVHIFVCL